MPNTLRVSKNGDATKKAVTGKQPIASPKPKITKDRREPIVFSPVQERIADSVADMLTHGATDQNLKRLIHATISHDYRRMFSPGTDADVESLIVKRQEKDTAEMLEALVQSRLKRLDLEKYDQPPVRNVTERIRAAARSECASELQQFIQEGDPEDIRMMSSLMVTYRCAKTAFPTTTKYGHAGLASAFQEEIDCRQEYLRIPSALMEDVQAYVNALMKTMRERE